MGCAVGLAGSEPALEVAAVRDTEHKEHAVFADGVVHEPVVADAEAVEGVCLSADRLHLLAADPARAGRCGGELLEAGADAPAQRSRQLGVDACGAGSETYLVGVAQAISPSGFERPRR